jgi:alanine racemase
VVPECPVVEARSRPAWAEIDLDAVRFNVSLLRHVVAPAALCAVVKADAYGHGAVPVARTAVEAGAAGLAVAVVDEGLELREHGVTAPVLVLAEAETEAAEAAARAGLTATVASPEGLARVAQAARQVGTRVAVHLKVDTGMHRLGAAPEQVGALAAAVAAEPAVRLEAVWTHLAVADGTTAEDRAFTALQLERFDKALAGMPALPPVRHAANTAAALAWPAARYDMVRCGIGVYGLPPSAAMVAAPGGAGRHAAPQPPAQEGDASRVLARLRPALSLKARVTAVRELAAGERPSYGRLRPLPEGSVVATVPLGYADGVPRALFEAGGDVLVGGVRRPLAGMVSMDQLMVDCGPHGAVAPGDEVVLVGAQGSEAVTAMEWAERLGTIGYEVLCRITPRVRRDYCGESAAGACRGLR